MAIGDRTKYGKILAEWAVPEYIKYQRTKTWYVVMGSIGVALLLYAAFTKNFLFVVILLLVALIAYLHERQNPEILEFMILEGGVVLGTRYYPYKEIKSFWIIYEPPDVKMLYFGIPRLLRHELPVHLENQNPVKLRQLLLTYLEEDLSKEDEATEETLARIMRL